MFKAPGRSPVTFETVIQDLFAGYASVVFLSLTDRQAHFRDASEATAFAVALHVSNKGEIEVQVNLPRNADQRANPYVSWLRPGER